MKCFPKILIFFLLSSLIFAPPILTGFGHLRAADTSTNQTDASLHYEKAARFLFWRSDLFELAGINSLDNPSRAIALLLKARKKGSLSHSGQLFLGDAFASNNQKLAAIAEWEDLQSKGVEIRNSSSRLVDYYHAEKNYAGEIRILYRWIVIDSNNPDVNKSLGLILSASAAPEATGMLNIANNASENAGRFENLLSALGLPDDSPEYKFVRIGQSLAELSEWTLAEKAFNSAVVFNRDYAAAWAWLGMARLNNGTPGAIDALNYALQLDPKTAAIYGMHGTYWQQINRPEKARKFFEKASQIEPDNAIWWLGLANAEAYFDFSKALNAYIHAANLSPQDARIWFALATFCVENNVYLDDYGLQAALRAFALQPKNPLHMDMLGRAQLAVGQLASAENILKQALDASETPNLKSMVYLHLGLLHLQTGDGDKARFDFEQSHQLDPVGIYGTQAQKFIARYFP